VLCLIATTCHYSSRGKTGYCKCIRTSVLSSCPVLFAAWSVEYWPIKVKLLSHCYLTSCGISGGHSDIRSGISPLLLRSPPLANTPHLLHTKLPETLHMYGRPSLGLSRLNLISAGCKAKNFRFVKVWSRQSHVTVSSSLLGCDPVSLDNMLTDVRRLQYSL
jgi:hypothetical protein